MGLEIGILEVDSCKIISMWYEYMNDKMNR
jgi:hypothetical protein